MNDDPIMRYLNGESEGSADLDMSDPLDRFLVTDRTTMAGHAARRVAGGAVDAVGGMIQAPAIAAGNIDSSVQRQRRSLSDAYAELDRVAAEGGQPNAIIRELTKQPGAMSRQALEYWRLLEEGKADEAQARRNELAAEIEQVEPTLMDPRETSLFKAGAAVQDVSRDPEGALYGDERYKDSFWLEAVPSGLGSTVTFLGTGLAGRALGLPGAAVTAGAGAGVNSSSVFSDALAHGADLETAYQAATQGAVVGTTEALPVSQMMSRLDKVTGGRVRKILAEGLKGATEEAIQETFTTVANNMIAQGLYDPERGTFVDAPEAAQVGGTVGFIMSTVMAALPGRRSGGGPVPPPPEEDSATPPTPPPAPPGEREQAATAPPEITPEDEASPIPTDLIAEGRRGMADAAASKKADAILGRNNVPPVNTPVTVTYADGNSETGVIADAFTTENAELGIAGDGVKILMDDGRVVEEYVDSFRSAGVTIAPIPQQEAPPAPSWVGRQAEEIFEPTADWQEVPKGAVVPPGLQIRMDQQSGKTFARLMPESALRPPQQQATTENAATGDRTRTVVEGDAETGKRVLNDVERIQAEAARQKAEQQTPPPAPPRNTLRDSDPARVPNDLARQVLARGFNPAMLTREMSTHIASGAAPTREMIERGYEGRDKAERLAAFDAPASAAQGNETGAPFTEAEAKESEPSQQAAPAPSATVEDYSAKSIIVRGLGKDHDWSGMKAKPLWNAKAKGWVFSKKREAEVRERLGAPAAAAPASDQTASTTGAGVTEARYQRAKAFAESKGGLVPLADLEAHLGEGKGAALTMHQRLRAEGAIRTPERRVVGKNTEGQTIEEDELGVRSIARGSIRDTEPVEVRPGGGVVKPDNRTRLGRGREKYLTADEMQALQEGRDPSQGQNTETSAESPRQAPEAPAESDASADRDRDAPAGAQAPAYGKTNKVFTEDAAAKARELLKRKLSGSQLNSGLDPEIVQAGITLAGYHIEAGARKFADYSRAMVADLGEGARPYLRSWYEGVRYYPGFDAAGMTPAAEIDAAPQQETDNAENERPEAGGVGATGVEGAGGGLAAGQPGRDGTRGALEGAPPEDAGASDKTGDRGEAGTRSAKPRGRRDPGQPQGRDASAGREGAGREGLADPRAGDGGRDGRSAEQPASVRPNFHVADPEGLIGGTPKVRFGRNQKAIETLRALDEEGRDPTADDLEALAAYTGWGSFGQELFQGNWTTPRPKPGWEKEDRWLRDHLGKDEWDAAQRSIINAHYTDPPTVHAMWEMVERMGFKGGRVLEPSMGIGNFFGMMPRDLMAASDLTGIELDSLTGSMAKVLYPQANVQIKGYEKSRTPDGFYDLVIGNWPFAADGPADRRYDKLGPSLHDYFFLKALDQTRAGGIVIGVTSAGTMDKAGRATRIELARKAELVTAFRLPTGAFEKYAGTKVVTDIIVLKKREKPLLDVSGEGWVETVQMATPAGPEIRVNEYWEANPGNVLGTLNFGSGTTYGRAAMIVDRPADFAERLAALPQRVPEGVFEMIRRGKEPRFITNNTADRESAVTESGGALYVVQGERLAALDDVLKYRVKDAAKTKEREDQIKALVSMRRAYGALMDAERDGAESTEALRRDLKKQYDAFRKKHGPVAESEGLGILRRAGDPFYPSLAALEGTDGKPARVLSEATTRAKKSLENPSIRDAFILARNEALTLDLARVAEMAGSTEEAVAKELLDSKAIYRTPGGGYEAADAYLSGNVRRKMREALAAQEEGENMAASIEALNRVMPKDVPYFQIEAKLGATWVGDGYYKQFIADLLGVSGEAADAIRVRFAAGSWKVRFEDRGQLNGRPEAGAGGWGTGAYSFDRLVRAAFNNQSITIKRKDDDGSEYVDEALSREANEKAGRIREEFSAWVWRDVERRMDLEKSYNEVMRAIADPQFDGSFMEFPGMALRRGDDPFSLRSHQVNAIWRGVANGRGIYAHEVGTGKTYTMGGIAVEARRYGVARKPLIFAHNANSATVAREINEMYPGAKVLYVDNLSPKSIDVTLRRIANDDWDAVVVPHSLIDRFAMREETLKAIAQEEIAALEEEAIAAAEEDGIGLSVQDMNDPEAMKKKRSVTAKELVKQRNRIFATIEKLSNRASREGAIAFEDLGVDMVLVDEAHEFKKPPLTTKMQVKGLNTGTSDRSIAMRFITDYVKGNNNGKGIHVFTGTPITNTLAEIYNMMRYVMDDQMARDGIKDWDGWFNTFADQVSDVELTPTGEYESVTRLSQFVNVAELRRMAGQYLDIVFADDMPEFKPRTTGSGKTLGDKSLTDAERDHLVNGRTETPVGRPYKKVVTDVGQMGDRQGEVLRMLVERARSFKAATKKERRELMQAGDPSAPLRVEDDAAAASLDVRLFEKDADDHPASKVNRTAANVLKHYKEHDKATQVVFVERGYVDQATRYKTVGDKKIKQVVEKFNLVTDLVDKLVAGGVKRSEIAIVDGATSKEQRKATADAMNKGTVRVVIGNTRTLGVGVNMQRNLRAMHHMDAPWMPGDLEQRNGRGHRQGNQWNTVMEYRYITEGLDGRRWQVLAIKDRFIKAFMRADDDVRVIDGDAVSMDEGESADSLAATLSEAAGDPRLLLRNKLSNDIRRLETKERMHTMGLADARRTVRDLKSRLEDTEKHAAKLADDAGHLKALKEAGTFEATVEGKTFDERKGLDEALGNAVTGLVRGERTDMGTVQGFKIIADWRNKFAAEPRYALERETEIGLAKPTIASIDGTLRAVGKRAEVEGGKPAEMRDSIKRLEGMTDIPFAQADALANKRKLQADIEADLQANPVPPPAWLRHGAPVGTLIHVDGEPRQVEGHRWTGDGWFVVTAEGDVEYLEARDENGSRLYEARPFDAPMQESAPASDKASLRPAADDTLTRPAAEADLRKRLERVGLQGKVALRMVEKIKGGDTIEGRYVRGLIEVALDARDPMATLNHEIIHALRDLGVLRPVEWNAVSRAAKRDAALMADVRERYKGRGLDEDGIVEEAVADLFAREAGDAQGTMRAAVRRVRGFFEALGNWLRGQGFESAEAVFRRSDRGEVGRRQPRDDQGRFTTERLSVFRPDIPNGPVTFDNPEAEARWRDAKQGMADPRGLVARAEEWFSYLWSKFTQHYKDLPNNARFADVKEQLRKIEAAPHNSKETVIRVLRGLTEGMTPADLDLFTRKVVLDDLMWEVQEGHDLPFGFKPEDVRNELRKVDQALASRDDLRQKVRERKLFSKRIADMLVDAGVLSRESIKNPSYYRHQVLDYARANTRYARGKGKKLRTPKWARREGSVKDINANLLEAEFDWLHKALMDVTAAKVITWIKASNHNVRDQVIADAKENNRAAMAAALERDLQENGYDVGIDRETGEVLRSSPLNDTAKAFKTQIAIGLSKVRKAIDDAEFEIPRHMESAARAITQRGAGDNAADIFPFLTWMLDNNLPGSPGAAQVYKAITGRKAWTKEVLGEQYVDPLNLTAAAKRFAPEGFVTWQPEEGKMLFTAQTIPEHAINRAARRIIGEQGGGLDHAMFTDAIKNELRETLAVGREKYQMVIPEELALTLNSLTDEHTDGLIEMVTEVPLRWWKRWILINPRRVLAYNLNNLSGDLDAVIAGNPRALKKMPQAIAELTSVMIRNKAPSQRYREAVERGVFDSGLSVQEIPDINDMADFEHLTAPLSWKRPDKKALRAVIKVWKGLQKFTQWRENWARYAAYLDYVERLEAGETVASIGYGASRQVLIDNVTDKKDQAALMARDLVGDYGDVSHYGQGIRRKLIPFYSWLEINTKRYWRLWGNAFKQGTGKGLRTAGLTGAVLGARVTGYLVLRMFVLYAAVNIWNHLLFGDEEDELDELERSRLHLNLGRGDDGTIRTIRIAGALSDFVNWIGFEHAIGLLRQVNDGKASYEDVVTAIAKAPVNKVVGGLTPVISMPMELASRKSYWPDVFDPRGIRDRGNHFFRLFSLDNEYDAITGRPMRKGYAETLLASPLKSRDVGEIAYNRFRGMTFDWLEKERGTSGGGGFYTPLSNALYYWRLARRYGDEEAEAKYLAELKRLGADAAYIRGAIKRAHPIGSIPIKDRRRFFASLTEKDRETFRKAVDWYQETYTK